MTILDRHGLPLAVRVASASPQETKLVEAALQQRFLPEVPQRMIGGTAYNGHFESTWFHPLLLSNRDGDSLAANRCKLPTAAKQAK